MDDARCGMCPPDNAGPSMMRDDSENSFQCDLCEEWFHDKCVGSDEYVKYISNEEPDGVHHSKGGMAVNLWFCKNCVTKNANLREKMLDFMKEVKKAPQISDKTRNDENPASTQISPTLTDTTVPSTVPVEAREDLTNVNGEQTKQICSHYKKGICRHGKFGTRLFNGHECNFLHPKKCLKCILCECQHVINNATTIC